jgi:hypothetical protein
VRIDVVRRDGRRRRKRLRDRRRRRKRLRDGRRRKRLRDGRGWGICGCRRVTSRQEIVEFVEGVEERHRGCGGHDPFCRCVVEVL